MEFLHYFIILIFLKYIFEPVFFPSRYDILSNIFNINFSIFPPLEMNHYHDITFHGEPSAAEDKKQASQ